MERKECLGRVVLSDTSAVILVFNSECCESAGEGVPEEGVGEG